MVKIYLVSTSRTFKCAESRTFLQKVTSTFCVNEKLCWTEKKVTSSEKMCSTSRKNVLSIRCSCSGRSTIYNLQSTFVTLRTFNILIANIQIVKQGVVQVNFDCGNCGYCGNCDCGCGNYINAGHILLLWIMAGVRLG